MTQAQSIARAIADLAADAAAVDRGERSHAAIIALLRDHGLLAMKPADSSALPVALRLSSKLGRGCVSSSLAFTMHMISVLYMTEFVPVLEPQDRLHLDRLLGGLRARSGGDAYIANCYAEPGSGAFIAGPETTARRIAEGWSVRGKKFGSFADAADFLQLHARVPDDSSGAIIQFLCPADLPGITFRALPSALGARAASPLLVVLDDVSIDDQWRFGPLGMFQATAAAFPFATLLTVAPYIGAAEKALEEALAYGQERKVGPSRTPLASLPIFKAMVADCFVRLEEARALLERAAEGNLQMSPLRAARIDAAKIAVATMAPRVCQEVLQLCGMRGLMDHLPFGRLLRDVQAAAHHPPSLAEARESISIAAYEALQELITG
jgi:alkylation response protein AidB-like acyl-CoA dehydrogenase